MSERRKLLGSDLKLKDDEEGSDLEISKSGDLATLSHEFNLGQAMINRLRTHLGEMRELGHASLGSRLYEFVGEPNNKRTREQIKAAVREALQQEPRVREVTRIEVKSNRLTKDAVDLYVSVIPIGEQTPLNIVMPFYLEVA